MVFGRGVNGLVLLLLRKVSISAVFAVQRSRFGQDAMLGCY